MDVRFEFRSYGRSLCPPMHTHHGLWKERLGILLRFQDHNGRTGFGEIAPLPWFGSETFDQALRFCQEFSQQFSQQSRGSISLAHIHAIPNTRPACQFGFESAWIALHSPNPPHHLDMPMDILTDIPNHRLSGLLPTGEAALTHWRSPVQAGYQTLKWKIGVASLEQELTWFQALHHHLPPSIQLRLDANGGLTRTTAHTWLTLCDTLNQSTQRIEFVEQPLSPEDRDGLIHLSQTHSTPIALDESIVTLPDLHQWLRQDWPGIFVIKPAIMGFPSALEKVCHTLDLVLSSVLETAIARQAILKLAHTLNPHRALGLGIDHCFSPTDPLTAALTTPPAHLWNRVPPPSPPPIPGSPHPTP